MWKYFAQFQIIMFISQDLFNRSSFSPIVYDVCLHVHNDVENYLAENWINVVVR